MSLELLSSVIVNNVGMVFGYPEYFGLMPIEKIEDMINVNIISAVKVGEFLS